VAEGARELGDVAALLRQDEGDPGAVAAGAAGAADAVDVVVGERGRVVVDDGS
jgi:hypothetical protein